MSTNPEGVEEDMGTPAEQIESLEAELADTKSLLAAVAGAVRQITRQFEEAMVAGILDNGTGGITDGWSAEVRVPMGSYGGVPMFMVDPPSTPGNYDFVMTLGPAGETIMTPISDRARNNEIHRLHRVVLAMRGILIGTGISTSMLDQIVGDLRCSSCHLTPIAPGSYRVTEPVEPPRLDYGDKATPIATQLADQYEQLTVETGRSPRHQMKLAVARLFEEWDIGDFDHDGLSDPLPSNAVLARRVVDLLDREGLLLKIYKAGLRRGVARGSHDGDDFGRAIALQQLTDTTVKRMFEKYWLGK